MPSAKQNKSKYQKPYGVKMTKMIAELPEQVKKIQASVQLRRNFLEGQKISNYINEYERLTGLMNSATTPALHHPRITARKKELEALARRSVEPPFHRIYKAP